MWTFIIGGTLYLIGVGVILMIRPAYMFTPDGDWKEFGIGQRDDRYTPFPFWLFCIVWAIVSYFLIMIILSYATPASASASAASSASAYATPNSLPTNTRRRKENYELEADADMENAVELPKGYYVLNKKATKLAGVPKYVYLGEEEP